MSKSPKEGKRAERSGSNGRAGEGDRTSEENVRGRSPLFSQEVMSTSIRCGLLVSF